MRIPTRPDSALLAVRVQPRARRDEVLGWRDAALRVRVTAPPEDGRANSAVIDLLARTFQVPRSSIALVGGAASRDKTFRIATRSLDELRARLAEAPA